MLSVVIPVYNVIKYINKTIKSVMDQTYTDFELILVDDGSTDGSGAVCDAFAEQDSRIKVIHQKNSGPSAARNAGLAQISGEYLTFIDADDHIDPDYFAAAFSLFAEHPEADVLVFGMKRMRNGTSTEKKLQAHGLMSAKEYLKRAMTFYDLEYGGAPPVNKIWRITQKKDICRFDEELWIAEDMHWVYRMLLGCSCVWLDDRAFYTYVYNDTSLKHNRELASKRLIDEIETYRRISHLDFRDPELQCLADFAFCHSLCYSFCVSLLRRDMATVTAIYTAYQAEWNRICGYALKHGRLIVKMEAIVCFLIGNTVCRLRGSRTRE